MRMTMLRSAGTAGALLTLGCAVIPSATAAAQPGGALLETTCSYEQVVAALRVEAPNAAARLAERPDAQAKVQELLGSPVDERRQRVQTFLDRNPYVRANLDEKRATPEGQAAVERLGRVADTCHNY
jgi:hemophore-related protein